MGLTVRDFLFSFDKILDSNKILTLWVCKHAKTANGNEANEDFRVDLCAGEGNYQHNWWYMDVTSVTQRQMFVASNHVDLKAIKIQM